MIKVCSMGGGVKHFPCTTFAEEFIIFKIEMFMIDSKYLLKYCELTIVFNQIIRPP